MGKTAKRQRKSNTGDTGGGAEKITSSPIIRLPFELIAEILLYSKSLTDVLSLSRTCKHFCATLVQNSAATFIWKRVRAQTKPPVPDPTKLGFSEPQLANFIYGEGTCRVCGKRTKHMYTSFSARIRFCGNQACRLKHSEQRQYIYATIPQYALWLPWIEWVRTGQMPGERYFTISDGRVEEGGMGAGLTYDREQLLQAKNEYNKAALSTTTLNEYKKRNKKCVDGLADYMNGCLALCNWKWELTRLQRIATMYNRAQVGNFADDRGQNKDDVRDTPTIARLLQEKLFDIEKITRQELEALWPKIEADLARIEGHRKRAEVEHSRQQRRREVELLYRELDHTEFDCFPSLPQFRKLPTLQKFYDSTLDVKSVKWRNEFVDTLVKNEVQEWAKRTVEAFLERLGYPEWPQTKTLAHPVHRASSRFTCIRCSKSGPKAKRNKALTFREAAHHMCLIPEEGNKDQWSPKNFILDVKAAAIITRFATAIGVDAEEKTATDLAAISRKIMCLSCSAPIVMDFDVMIQHSHRHDDMQFMILADEELVKFSDYPVLRGVTAKLMQTKEWRSSVSVGCKHCTSNPLATRETDGKAPKSSKGLKAFKLDGLRSHLKEKHKVMEVADEDLFVFDKHLKDLGYNV